MQMTAAVNGDGEFGCHDEFLRVDGASWGVLGRSSTERVWQALVYLHLGDCGTVALMLVSRYKAAFPFLWRPEKNNLGHLKYLSILEITNINFLYF